MLFTAMTVDSYYQSINRDMHFMLLTKVFMLDERLVFVAFLRFKWNCSAYFNYFVLFIVP